MKQKATELNINIGTNKHISTDLSVSETALKVTQVLKDLCVRRDSLLKSQRESEVELRKKIYQVYVNEIFLEYRCKSIGAYFKKEIEYSSSYLHRELRAAKFEVLVGCELGTFAESALRRAAAKKVTDEQKLEIYSVAKDLALTLPKDQDIREATKQVLDVATVNNTATPLEHSSDIDTEKDANACKTYKTCNPEEEAKEFTKRYQSFGKNFPVEIVRHVLFDVEEDVFLSEVESLVSRRFGDEIGAALHKEMMKNINEFL
ncbi:MAG: hypothetical protein HQL69_22975 [Magnetococcales bacterium]|nr:hypothetical protein [Magnetococcales bacterium]